MRHNVKLNKHDLVLSQLTRRLHLAQVREQGEADEGMSELIIGGLGVGILLTFCLLLWVMA